MNIASAPELPNINNYNAMVQSNIISQQNNQQQLTKFEQLVKRKELNLNTAKKLSDILSTCKVVLLCDDSDSMSQPIAEEGIDPFAPKLSTRWLELKKLAAVIIEFITSINDNGLDIYFLNRQKICNVSTVAGLQNIFNIPPCGGTGLTHSLMELYHDNEDILKEKKLLIIVITDGEPTDDSNDPRGNLFKTINYIVSNSHDNTHVSFAECTDNAEDMEYLDRWDGLLRNFDNTDDYREELLRVKSIQGQQFKFDYTDYVIKILLATFDRWYYNLDQVRVNNNNNNNNNITQQYITQTQIFQPINYTVPYNPSIQSISDPNLNTYSNSNLNTYSNPNLNTYSNPTPNTYSDQKSNRNNDNGCCVIL